MGVMKTSDLPFSVSFKLKTTSPYSFALTVHKPAGWSLLTPYEIFEDNILWTAARFSDGEMHGLKIESAGNVNDASVICELFSRERPNSKEIERLREMVAWMLSAQEDIRPFYALAKRDSLVNALVHDLFGMRRTKRLDIFPQLILAVTLQMAPIKRSDQMMTLLIEQYGEKVAFNGKEIKYWPSPEKIAKASVTELRERCKLGYRAPVLKGIADDVRIGFPTFRDLEAMSEETAKTKLMELKGIGDYSADIVSPHPGFALDIWSAKIFNLLLFGKETKLPRTLIPKLKRIAEKRWGEWRGYVFTYVLNDIPNLARSFKLNLEEL
jgi:3-methyladenine DNA glycosylase/8-oxoguanine DNA glycosylase